MTRSFVQKRYAKSEEYKHVLAKITGHGKCPFCYENLRDYSFSKHTPVKTTHGWYLLLCSWPYKGARHHYLIIPKRHCESLEKLTAEDMRQVLQLARHAVKKFNIKGGGLLMRFGDSLYSGATVLHLHFHVMSPQVDTSKKKAKVISFPIG